MEKIYLDNAATTKPDEESLSAAIEFLKTDGFYNPSALYKSARKVKNVVEEARKKLLSFFPSGYDAVFTSCGSEADDMAIFSFARRGNAVTDVGEHAAVFNTFAELKQRGVETRFAPLNKNGQVDAQKLIDLIDEKTAFVSVMQVNNETGAINDVNAISAAVKHKNPNVIFHCDGVQGFLKLPQKISQNVDIYCISAHKIKALKGLGAIVYKKNLPLKPLILGGGQEKKLRSGTENTLGIDVFLRAMNKFFNVEKSYENAKKLKAAFLNRLANEIESGVIIPLSDENCSPYILSISVKGVKAEIMQRVLDDEGVIVGTGSACSSKIGVSRVISACVSDKLIAEGALRISFSFDTSEAEVILAADKISACAKRLKAALK
ncbi:MAG: cysteine desulfurase family protein [Candidatus Borkfalkiaceae bacterium]|nr:cysteine desulfurase family protein [Christensenellaceae bacterium]